MTDLRGERVDEGKVWAACPRCLGREGVMFQHTEQEYQELKERYNDAVDKNAALRARVKHLEDDVRDLRDKGMRARADLSNYRRRAELEKDELKKFGNALLLARILPVMDDLERATQAIPRELWNFTWVDGDLRKYYAENEKRYATPEERRASHILVKAEKSAPATEREKAGRRRSSCSPS